VTHGAHAPPGGAARILVVDDEPNISSFVSRALRGHGYTVTTAPDGRQALELFRGGEYGLVVLDLVMPEVDGIAALRSILLTRPGQSVLVLSARTDVESKVRCLELGAVDYLTKPFALAVLLARVRARLRHAAEPPSERFIRVGRLTLDLQRHVADAGSGPVSLSTREFELLLHLMHRAGTVCSREQLLAEVWNTEFDPGTNVVDVYIRRLRAKLGGDAIETLRNMGYALRAA
jgi:DNA-binding response OmpR family regulator